MQDSASEIPHNTREVTLPLAMGKMLGDDYLAYSNRCTMKLGKMFDMPSNR